MIDAKDDITRAVQQYFIDHKIQIEFNTIDQCRQIHQFMNVHIAELDYGFVTFHRTQLLKDTFRTYSLGHYRMDGYITLSFIEFEMLTTNSYGLLMAICL